MRNLPVASGASRRTSWIPYALAAVLISLLVIGLAAMALWQEKQHYQQRAAVATQNISRLLDQHLNDVFDKIDVVLQTVASDYREQSIQRRLDPAQLDAYLARQQALVPEVVALRILDSHGIVRFGNDVPRDKTVDLSERSFFTRSRDDPAGGLVITGVGFAPINKQWVIAFARRLSAPDGSFAGVAYALLPTSHFEKLFSSLSLGTYGAATIRTADLALVHRYPDAKSAIGSTNVSQELLDQVQASPRSGEFIAKTGLDSIERSNAYRKLERYPFYVIVGLAPVDYMESWRTSVLMFAGLAGLVILITSLTAMLVYRSAKRQAAEIAKRRQTESELQAHREQLETMVAERTKEVRRLAAEATFAEERERHALARNLHDDLGQLLYVAKFRIELLEREALSEKGRAVVEQTSSIIADASRLVRSLTSQLSPPILKTLGLSPALRWLGDELHRIYNLAVDCRADIDETSLSPDQSAILFRSARELLINVAKHSGNNTARLEVRHDGSTLTMAVEDSGKGIQDVEKALAGKRGFGLANVRERICSLGGEMTVETPATGGLRIILRVPLESEATITEVHA